MSNAVFRSTGQALHVSFLMEILPSTQKGGTQIVIESLKRAQFVIDCAGMHTINSSGLSPLELRGQCAMVRGSVDHHLPETERAVVWARFGHQLRKAHGVLRLSAYLAALVPLSGEALKALTWSCFVPMGTGRDRRNGRRNDWSLRKLERQYGVPKATLHDARQAIRYHAGHLEREAESRLQALFERTGLIECEEAMAEPA